MPAWDGWGNDLVDVLVGPLVSRGVEPHATWRNLPRGARIAPYDKPKTMSIVAVVGGETSPMRKVADFAHTTTAWSIDCGPRRTPSAAPAKAERDRATPRGRGGPPRSRGRSSPDPPG